MIPAPALRAVAPVAMSPPVTVEVHAELDVSRARIAAVAMARRLGFGQPAAYRLATAVSELANNLVFHATRGGIELRAQDDGPGIVDVARAMRDGVSTNGGLGGGLPGTRRLMDEFEIDSVPGVGTRVVARLWR